MGQYSREEILAAFEKYNTLRLESQKTGDWSIWASIFTEDAHYVEHAYGEFDGREAIAKWICDVMSPFPEMTFPQDWVAIDEDGEIIDEYAIQGCCSGYQWIVNSTKLN